MTKVIERTKTDNRRRSTRRRPVVLGVVVAAVLLFMLFPVLVVGLYSFNDSRSLATFDGPSLRWYRALLDDDAILASIRTSLQIGIVTSLVAGVLGTGIAIGLERSRSRFRGSVNSLIVLQLATPEIACAAGVALLLTNLSVHLSTWTVIMAHITFGLIYVALVVRSALVGMNGDIEDAARDLGASEFATLRLIVLPMLWPAIIGSMLLVFVLSFGDFVTTFFTAGVDDPPLPLLIYGMARRGISPEVNAIGVAMIVVTVGCAALAAALLFARGRRSRSTESHDRE